MASKVCIDCGMEKNLTDFYPHPSCRDGHIGQCKQCKRRYANEHRQQNLAKVREYDRARPKRPYRNIEAKRATNRRGLKTHNAKHRDRYIARTTLARHVKRGKIARLPCHVCGSTPSEAHHEDYSKPLDVIWVCRLHHLQIHKKRGK